MKINIYDKFECMADRCSFTCCKEWKIAIDEETAKRWETTDSTMLEKTWETEDGRLIRLDEHKNCPFLNESGLCKLVLKHGEEILSHTCHTFPRQCSKFSDHVEKTLSACCPAVIDLLNEAERIELCGKRPDAALAGEAVEMQERRKGLVSIMQQENYTMPMRFMLAFYILLEVRQGEKAFAAASELFAMAETIQAMPFSAEDTFFERNELFLDMIANYRKQNLYTPYLEPLEREALSYEEFPSQWEAFCDFIPAYQHLIQNYLISELYVSAWMPDSTFEDMLVAFEWIAMEYAVIMQALFLRFSLKGSEALSYEEVRDIMVVMNRITGFDAGEVAEYIEESFEDKIWDWGYLALLMGDGEI